MSRLNKIGLSVGDIVVRKREFCNKYCFTNSQMTAARVLATSYDPALKSTEGRSNKDNTVLIQIIDHVFPTHINESFWASPNELELKSN